MNCFKIILFSGLCLSLLGCNQKNNKGGTDKLSFSLVTCFIGDTVLYKSISYKIRIRNNDNVTHHLFLERAKGLLTIDESSSKPEKNSRFFVFDSAHNKVEELLMSPLFPNEIIINPKKNIDLLFVSSGNGMNTFDSARSDNKALLRKAISESIRNKQVYFYKLESGHKITDSSRIGFDKDFTIEFSAPFVDDF